MNDQQDSMIFSPIPVKFFFFKTLSKKTSITMSINLMEVIELQTNDSLKNAFKPSDLRIFYSGLPSEIFPKIRQFVAASTMTVLASTHICKQTFFFFLIFGKTSSVPR
jgi:hypothetical protein